MLGYKEIKEKIERYSIEKSKAEGVKEKLIKQLKDEFKVSLENVETLLDEEYKKIEENIKKRNVLMKNLDSLADWDSL